MPSRHSAAALLLLACLWAPGPAAADNLVTLQQKVLDNGVTVIVWATLDLRGVCHPGGDRGRRLLRLSSI